MKKTCFVLTIFFLLLSGCSGRSNPAAEPGTKQPTEKKYYMIEEGWMGSTCTLSDLGVLRSRMNGAHSGVLYFFDPVSEKEVPLCTKANCTHQGYSWENAHPDCDACFGEITQFAAIIGDSLYYVSADSEDGLLRKELCRADLDGTNRKVLAVVEDAQYFQPGAVFCEDGFFFYLIRTECAEDGTRLEKRRAGVFLYDLEREEAVQVTVPENYNAAVASATVLDGCLYYVYCYCTEDPFRETDYDDVSNERYWEIQEYVYSVARWELWAYDLETKEQRLVMQEGGTRITVGLECGYAYTKDEDGVRLINLSTGERRELGSEMVERRRMDIFEGGCLLQGSDGLNLLDLETGEVKHLGSYDQGEIITYIGEDWVYGMKIEEGREKMFYLPRERFMKGDLEWKYLPQED